MRDGLPANAITALAEDDDGRLWVGTDAGLILWQNGQLLPLKASAAFKDQRITALFKDRQGQMWVGVKGAGTFHFVDNTFVPLAGDSMEELLKDPHCLLMDHTGQMWIGAGEDFVLCHDGDRWHRYRIPRNQAKSHISTLAEESDGTIWAGSAGGGLLQIKEGKSVAIPAGSAKPGGQSG